MLKAFPIDFIRQILEQKLFQEHLENVNFFGGSNQVNIFSFYEQLKSQDEVDRFVENYRELTEQQNRTGLILNGVVIAPENPTITNLYSSLIIPMTWTCSFRCTLGNRDQAMITINNLIEKLKGKKVDIAQLDCVDDYGRHYAKPFMVGTLGQGSGLPMLKQGDYLGTVSSTSDVATIIADLRSNGFGMESQDYWFYCEKSGKLVVAYRELQGGTISFIEDDGTYPDVIFPPTHSSFEKYKVSLSFDAIRCDEPRTLNAQEYCELSFGGSATLVSSGVSLGNDLLKVMVKKLGIPADTYIEFSNATSYWLEPLELPSGSNINTQINQLVSNKFMTNTHADAIALSLQYTFILDRDIKFLDDFFLYARYGTQGITKEDISPNMEYGLNEFWCSWGKYEFHKVVAKVIENVDIENTEGDTLTIGFTFQIQREWVIS